MNRKSNHRLREKKSPKICLDHVRNSKIGNSGLFIATRASARLGVLRNSRLGCLGDSANPGCDIS